MTPDARLRDLIGEYGEQLPPRAAVAIQELVRTTLEDAARAICALCREEIEHAECLAAEIWALRG